MRTLETLRMLADGRLRVSDPCASIRVAKGLNAMMKRHGRVLADRFHAHILRTPTEVRRAVAYVRGFPSRKSGSR